MTLYTTKQVAEMYGCTTRYIRELCKSGKLKAIKTVRDWVITQSEVNKLLRKKGKV